MNILPFKKPAPAEFSAYLHGEVFRVVFPDYPNRKIAQREHILPVLDFHAVTHVLAGNELEAWAVPIRDASLDLLRHNDLLRPPRKGESFFPAAAGVWDGGGAA